MPTNEFSPGAHLTPDGERPGVRYRVWAPGAHRVEVVRFAGDGRTVAQALELAAVDGGFFQAVDPAGHAGDLYKFRLDSEEGKTFPDPLSRFQPHGVHGPSQVMPSGAYAWQHEDTRPRLALDDLVIYELHIGTFTPEGTFLAAIGKLEYLKELGVTAIEIMPLADFPGRWNWGYDGVMLYAPTRAYGQPDDLRTLIDAAHVHGLAVMLDAVYNHLGPDGNYLGAYTKDYFNPAHHTPWGDALNFDGHNHAPVREFFLGNVVYWMEEFHFDGFRLDAVHAILDDSGRHILANIASAVQDRGGFVFAEDERNAAFLATPQAEGGTGLNGLWADDFHHSVRVAITGERDAYLKDFTGSVEELADTLANGWHYRGQVSPNSGHERGTECAQLPAHAFCYCISNHDQVGNRAFGERLDITCGREAYRAASALLCLAPYVPLIFQGQEWAASTPFLYFTDHNAELGRLVTEGRRKEFAGFAAFSDPETVKCIPDPQAESTFNASKLNWDELGEGIHAQTLELYHEALRLRREEAALGQRRERDNVQTVALGEEAVSMIYTDPASGEMCMVVFNLRGGSTGAMGIDEGPDFELIFTSNDQRFGGSGVSAYDASDKTMRFERPELLVLRARV